jgi:hypothetical protein
MKLIILITMCSVFHLHGAGTCKKCEMLRKYHQENPCPYEYYEDYLKALEEKKAIPKNVKSEEPEVPEVTEQKK